MTALLKKILVLLPVMALTVFFIRDQYVSTYKYASDQRLLLFSLTLLLPYACMVAGVMRRRQAGLMQIGLQSSFYVYVFMVLSLTGYFILFREISLHHWWERMHLRVVHRDHVNFEPLKVFRIYKLSSRQVMGNLVMLFPLGIYLPLLYRWASNFFVVVLFSLLVSVGIELLQLATSFRSTDIDDVLLNTAGAAAGFLCLYSLRSLRKRTRSLPATAMG